jgi:hypothetical protein
MCGCIRVSVIIEWVGKREKEGERERKREKKKERERGEREREKERDVRNRLKFLSNKMLA